MAAPAATALTPLFYTDILTIIVFFSFPRWYICEYYSLWWMSLDLTLGPVL